MSTISHRYTSGNPCPVCETSTKGCSVTDDGLHLCRGEPRPDFTRMGERDGWGVFRHRDDPVLIDRRKSKSPPPPDEATIANVDKGYRTLAERAGLSITHRAALAKRGLTDEEITAAGYWTLPRGEAKRRAMFRNNKPGWLTVPGVFACDDGKLSICAHPGIVVPLRDADRRIRCAQVRADDPKAGPKYSFLSAAKRGGAGPIPIAHVPLTSPATASTVWAIEGPLKGDICAPRLPSGDGVVAIAGVGSYSLAIDAARSMGASTIVWSYDCDWRTNADVRRTLMAGMRATTKAGMAAKLATWELKDGKGLDDLLTAGHKPTIVDTDEAITIIENIDRTPEVVIDVDEYRVADEVIRAIARDTSIYARAGQLVEVIGDDPPSIRPLPKPSIRERITKFSQLVKISDTGKFPAHPESWLTDAVAARGRWDGIRTLRAVVPYPVILSDGTLLSSDGYHPDSGLFLSLPPRMNLSVPTSPTQADAKQAACELLDVVSDFPFAADHHRAAWLAALLTPLARYAIDGPCPLFLIDKNVRGAGAGLLASVITLIITGRDITATTFTNDSAECRKRITAIARAGLPITVFDNIIGEVGNDAIDAALTCTTWSDRILGRSEILEYPLLTTWIGTANNVMLTADTSRRVLPIRLNSPLEKPENRTDVRHHDLREFVTANRGRLLTAALTILRAWFAAGKPRHRLPAWGSYDRWSAIVREAIAYAGLPDPADGRELLQSKSDIEARALAGVIAGLRQMDTLRRGLTTSQIINSIASEPYPPDWIEDFRESVQELCGELSPKSLGYAMRRFAERNVGGSMIVEMGKSHKVTRWGVVSVSGGMGGDGGDGGDVSTLPAWAGKKKSSCDNAPVCEGAKTSPPSPPSPPQADNPTPTTGRRFRHRGVK